MQVKTFRVIWVEYICIFVVLCLIEISRLNVPGVLTVSSIAFIMKVNSNLNQKASREF